MIWNRTLSPSTFLHQVGNRRRPRIIDFRGNYRHTLPGAIPVQYDPDFFYEKEEWVQDMLGVPFRTNQLVVLVCAMGHSAQLAREYFYEMNPRSRFQLRVLKGGWEGYVADVDRLTEGYKQKSRLARELTDLATPQERFEYLARGLMERERPRFLGIPVWRYRFEG